MGNNKTKNSRHFFSVDFAPVAKQRHARVQKVHFFWPVVLKTRQKRLVLKLKILIHAKWLNLRFFHLLVGKGGEGGQLIHGRGRFQCNNLSLSLGQICVVTRNRPCAAGTFAAFPYPSSGVSG
jgi:hypothetical protein